MRRFLALAAAALLAAPAFAATRTWNGSAGNLWSNPANWGGTLPAAGDDLVFPAAANMISANDLPAGTAFHSISVTGGPYSITGNAVGLSSGISVTAAGVQTTINPSSITLNAPQTWSTAPSTQVDVGATNVNGQTLTLANGASLIIDSVSGGGTIVNAGTDHTTIDASTFTGAIGVSSGNFFLFSGSAGNLTQTGGTLAIQSSNVGAINVSGGTFTLAHLSSSGSLTLGPGATFDASLWPIPASKLTVTGSVTLNNAVLHLTSLFPTGTSFVLIDNDGADPVSGTFQGLPEGSIVNVNGMPFRISYAGGTGNDVTLTAVTAVPLFGPAALMLLALALAAIALAVIRR